MTWQGAGWWVAALLALVLLLGGCTVPGPPVVICPPLAPLPRDVRLAVAAELAACGERCTATKGLVGDHLDLRAVIAACGQAPAE